MTELFISNSYEETVALGKKFAENLCGGDKVLLNGDLGAGKTAFTQGIAAGLCVTDLVTSPTFTILNTFIGKKLELYHFDMYRIDNESDIFELGLDDYLYYDNGVCVIEWNKFENLKGRVFNIKIERIDDNVRKITIEKQFL